MLGTLCECFVWNDVSSPDDMVGLKMDRLARVPEGGKSAFIQRAINKANDKKTGDLLPVVPERSTGMESLIRALKKEDPKVHVDLLSKLPAITLEDTASQCLPKGELVDDIETCKTKRRSKGIAHPFIFVELAKYLPVWALKDPSQDVSDDDTPVSKEILGLAKALGAPPKAKAKLSLVQWIAAFDRYAIAAAATNQLTLPAALAHKDLVLKLGSQASSSGRRIEVGIIYDELVRSSWANRSYHGEKLDLASEGGVLDKAMLAQAEAIYDSKAKHTRSFNDKGHNRQWNSQGSSFLGKRPFYKDFERDHKKARTGY